LSITTHCATDPQDAEPHHLCSDAVTAGGAAADQGWRTPHQGWFPGTAYDQVAEVFTHPDSPRRLVVPGDPGAGKSMLVLHLTAELLRLRVVGAS
jgi:hypothetical protein